MFRAEIWKILEFLSENFQFLVVKFSIYLNRRVFVMGLNDKKEPENINYPIVKYKDTFYGRHTALKTNISCSADKCILKGMPLESKEHPHKLEQNLKFQDFSSRLV